MPVKKEQSVQEQKKAAPEQSEAGITSEANTGDSEAASSQQKIAEFRNQEYVDAHERGYAGSAPDGAGVNDVLQARAQQEKEGGE